MRKSLLLIFLVFSQEVQSQTVLTIKGQTYLSTETGTWNGVEIAKATPTIFSFLDNSISAKNTGGYMLLAGDEVPVSTNNNLDNAIVSGNNLNWDGSVDNGLHGIFAGYNKNCLITYNYLNKVPYGIILKSGIPSGSNMTFSSGGIAYNIFRNSSIGVRIKGINGVCVYNNTFYDDLHTSVPATIYISSNPDFGALPSTGTKIMNNIFYSAFKIANIYIEEGCDTGFESDYNVFFCESGTPVFSYHGAEKTFAQWQALGFDIHSRVINPDFINTTALVPGTLLNFGINLGQEWVNGLSTIGVWGVTDPLITIQSGSWQIGARIYDLASQNPTFISAVVQNASPSVVEITYSSDLANVVPGIPSFNIQVNSVNRTINSITILGNKVWLTLSDPLHFNEIITFSYTKPASNFLQSVTGGAVPSLSSETITNNCLNINPVIAISLPRNNDSYKSPATVVLNVNATDIDGSIVKVEYFSGTSKIGEVLSAPFSFTWNNIAVGNYHLTAIATDDFNARTTSDAVSFSVVAEDVPVNKPPVVNIISPVEGSTFPDSSTIEIKANAYDPDGSISKLAFFDGNSRLAEFTAAPYLLRWSGLKAGTYSLTAIASDNSNASVTSAPVIIHITKVYETNSEMINLYPTPNQGLFSIEILKPLKNETNIISIVDFAGKKVYDSNLFKEEITRQINLPFLNTGIYVLMIIGSDILITKKFIVE